MRRFRTYDDVVGIMQLPAGRVESCVPRQFVENMPAEEVHERFAVAMSRASVLEHNLCGKDKKQCTEDLENIAMFYSLLTHDDRNVSKIVIERMSKLHAEQLASEDDGA